MAGPGLLSGIEGDERNVVLTLARMWFTALTGEIVSKDVAAEWAENHLPDEQSALLCEARLAYLRGTTESWESKQVELNVLVESMRQEIDTSLGKKF